MISRHWIFVLLIINLVLVSACRKQPSLSNARFTNTPQQTNFETRVYIRKQCLLSEPKKLEEVKKVDKKGLPLALASIFLPIIIEKGIKAIGSALVNAGGEDKLQDSGILPTYLYQIGVTDNGESIVELNPEFGCVILVRGNFTGPDEGPDFDSPINYSSGTGILDKQGQESQRIKRLDDNKIPVRKIAAVYEAKIHTSKEKNAFFYQSKFLQVNEFLGNRSSNIRGLVISFLMNGIAADEDDNELSVALINIGEIEKGVILGDDISNKKSGWRKGLGLSPEQISLIQDSNLNQSDGIAPVTITGTFTETENGNKALVFIGEVLKAGATAASEELSDQALKGKEREEEKATAIEEMQVDEAQAYDAYITARISRRDLSSSNEEEIEQSVAKLEEAERKWCKKYNALKKLGRAPVRSFSSSCN